MSSADFRISSGDWLRLILLSILWGGSFFFIGVAVKELPPLTIVFSRVALAAVLLMPLLWIYKIEIPRTFAGWWPFIVMSLLNNVIPFSLSVGGQTMIASGLASVINATTPVFTVLVLAAFGEERLIPRRVVGVVLGLLGVMILQGLNFDASAQQSFGILLCLCSSITFGFSALWAKRTFKHTTPIAAATFQLMVSSVLMFVLCAAIEQPWQLPMPGLWTWLALLALGASSTALGFLLFFRIMRTSGPGNVMLVTLLVPVTAIMLGYLILDEIVTSREIIGALVIASALLIMDGRLLSLFSSRKANR